MLQKPAHVVFGAGIEVRDVDGEPRRKILVKEKLHERLAERLGRGHAEQTALPVCGEGEASENVLTREERKICQDLILTHSGRQVRQDVAHCNTRTTYDWLAEADGRVDNNPVVVVHTFDITTRSGPGQAQFRGFSA